MGPFFAAIERPQRLSAKGLALGVGDLAKMVGTSVDCPAIQQGGKAANGIGVFEVANIAFGSRGTTR